MIKQWDDKITKKIHWSEQNAKAAMIVKRHYNWIKKYIQKTIKHLRCSFIFEIASGWNPLAISSKKLPRRCLSGIQVGKIGDDTYNKGTSKLI